MQLKFSTQRIAFASVASVVWILLGLGNLSSGRWSKPVAVLFVILAPVLTFIVAVTINPARQGIFGSPGEKRQAIGQFRTTVLIWVAAFVAILIWLKLVHWYQTP
jgi:hypothetical protein